MTDLNLDQLAGSNIEPAAGILHKPATWPASKVLFNAHMGACASSAQWKEALSCCLQAGNQQVRVGGVSD